MSVTKRKRTHKVSQGVHGSTKTHLTDVQLVLLGKGLAQSLQPVDCRAPWRGTLMPSNPVFNAKQVTLNKVLYPHLFREEGR